MPTLLGLNSGTSADGVDAVLVRFDGELPRLPLEILASLHRPYPDSIRNALERISAEWQASTEELCSLHYELGAIFADAAAEALAAARLPAQGAVDVCGSHGQTVYHLPSEPAHRRGRSPSTWQMGEAAVIAERIGAPVAAEFRAADVAAGGEGAPLTPILDHLLFTHPERTRIRLNIGGIANLTWLPPSARAEDVVAFDSGPGNALVDQLVRVLTGGREPLDHQGRRAARGRVDDGLLREMLAEPYFARKPPKSTGRELFSAAWLEPFRRKATLLGISDEDLIATVTALTPASIGQAVRHHLPPQPAPDEVIVHGGGARNPIMIEGLRRRLPPAVTLRTVEDFGIPLQALEPVLFATLGWLCLRRIPVFYPGATGLRHPVVLGKLAHPAAGRPRG